MVEVKIVTGLLTENPHSSTQGTVDQYRDAPQVNRVKLLFHVALTVATFSISSLMQSTASGGGRLSRAIETVKSLREKRCLGYYLQAME